MLEAIIRDNFLIPVGTHEGKRVILAADHHGFVLKTELNTFLLSLGFVTEDVGTCSAARCDYPDYASRLGKRVSLNYLTHVGIAICGSGFGVGIVAGKFPFVYPTRCMTKEDALVSRKHNNANVLVLSGDKTAPVLAKEIVEAWLTTPFYTFPTDEPYLNRYLKMVKIDMGQFTW